MSLRKIIREDLEWLEDAEYPYEGMKFRHRNSDTIFTITNINTDRPTVRWEHDKVDHTTKYHIKAVKAYLADGTWIPVLNESEDDLQWMRDIEESSPCNLIPYLKPGTRISVSGRDVGRGRMRDIDSGYEDGYFTDRLATFIAMSLGRRRYEGLIIYKFDDDPQHERAISCFRGEKPRSIPYPNVEFNIVGNINESDDDLQWMRDVTSNPFVEDDVFLDIDIPISEDEAQELLDLLVDAGRTTAERNKRFDRDVTLSQCSKRGAFISTHDVDGEYGRMTFGYSGSGEHKENKRELKYSTFFNKPINEQEDDLQWMKDINLPSIYEGGRVILKYDDEHHSGWEPNEYMIFKFTKIETITMNSGKRKKIVHYVIEDANKVGSYHGKGNSYKIGTKSHVDYSWAKRLVRIGFWVPYTDKSQIPEQPEPEPKKLTMFQRLKKKIMGESEDDLQWMKDIDPMTPFSEIRIGDKVKVINIPDKDLLDQTLFNCEGDDMVTHLDFLNEEFTVTSVDQSLPNLSVICDCHDFLPDDYCDTEVISIRLRNDKISFWVTEDLVHVHIMDEINESEDDLQWMKDIDANIKLNCDTVRIGQRVRLDSGDRNYDRDYVDGYEGTIVNINRDEILVKLLDFKYGHSGMTHEEREQCNRDCWYVSCDNNDEDSGYDIYLIA